MVKKAVSKEREERLAKLKDPESGKFFIVPIHHGLIYGPIAGLGDVKRLIKKVTYGGATGVILQKGILRNVYRGQKRELAAIMHLSANTTLGPDQNHTVLIGTVQEALMLGSIGVSIQVNVGADKEPEMLHDFGLISTDCNMLKVPLIAFMYPRGPMIDDSSNVELVKHAVRIGAELGADIVITNYTGSIDTFKEVTSNCPVPVLVAGGPKKALDLEILKLIKSSLLAGAAGVAFGRNIYQNEHVLRITKAINQLLHGDADVDVVYKKLMKNGK